MSQPPTDDESLRDRETITTNADDDERMSRKVVYEHTATSGSSHSAGITIGIIVIIAIVLIAYILMHVHR
ncbi:MAG: hypothetical protein M3P29_00305 [Acidobacteriota bacterium]|nr:hypothetical protein [Acidobacteriota bacterium]